MRSHVLFHLREAAEELNRTVNDAEGGTNDDEDAFSVAMQHLYHHLNTAWNTRRMDDAQVQAASDTDFNEWSRYPADLPTMEV